MRSRLLISKTTSLKFNWIIAFRNAKNHKILI